MPSNSKLYFLWLIPSSLPVVITGRLAYTLVMKKGTPKTERYAALLRGINVGGNNIIKMSELKLCFESLGFLDVSTYINSGNVLFSSAKNTTKKSLAGILEKKILDYYKLPIKVVVVTAKDMIDIVKNAPRGFGSRPEDFRYDVMFLKPPLKAEEAVKDLPLKEEVDRAWAGRGVIYFSRVAAKASQSRMPRIVLLPIYKSVTIRNWNTATKLSSLLEACGL